MTTQAELEKRAEEWIERNCEPIIGHFSDGSATTGGFKHSSIAKAAYLAGATEREAGASTREQGEGVMDEREIIKEAFRVAFRSGFRECLALNLADATRNKLIGNESLWPMAMMANDLTLFLAEHPTPSPVSTARKMLSVQDVKDIEEEIWYSFADTRADGTTIDLRSYARKVAMVVRQFYEDTEPNGEGEKG